MAPSTHTHTRRWRQHRFDTNSQKSGTFPGPGPRNELINHSYSRGAAPITAERERISLKLVNKSRTRATPDDKYLSHPLTSRWRRAKHNGKKKGNGSFAMQKTLRKFKSRAKARYVGPPWNTNEPFHAPFFLATHAAKKAPTPYRHLAIGAGPHTPPTPHHRVSRKAVPL